MSEARKGRTFTNESKARIAAAINGRSATAEAVAKRSAKITGMRRTAEQIEAKRAAAHQKNGSKKLAAFGKKQSLADWVREYRINKATLRNRFFRSKVSLEKALTGTFHKRLRS